jgi:hypothetical protein
LDQWRQSINRQIRRRQRSPFPERFTKAQTAALLARKLAVFRRHRTGF